MPVKTKTTKTSSYLLLTAGFSLAVAFLLFGLVGAQGPDSNQNSRPIPDKFQNQSTVVRTHAPRTVKQAAASQNVPVLNTTQLPDGETLVVLGASTLHPSVQAISRTTFGADYSPNFTYRLSTHQSDTEPDDTNFSDQWNLDKIQAEKGWDITKGDSNVTMAIIDTGVLFHQQWDSGNHDYDQLDFPDTKKWTNSGEMGSCGPTCDKQTNGVDDDNNGKIDDWQGWDFMGGFRGSSTACPNHNDSSEYEYGGTNPDFQGLLLQDKNPQPYACDNPNDHDLLNKNHYNNECSYGTDSNDNGNIDGNGGACYVGHGTVVGSVAAAATNNAKHIASLNWQGQVMNLRVLDGYGFTSTGRVVAAVEYATEMGADVINLSLAVYGSGGCTSTDSALEEALKTARNNGIITAAASGNEGASQVCYPANSKHTLAVGASNDQDKRAGFSNYGPKLDLIAPGTSVPAASAPSKANGNNHYTSSASGTSLATPHVTGAAGLIKALAPNTSFKEGKYFITRKGVNIVPEMTGEKRTDKHGYGRLNTYKHSKFTGTSRPDGVLVTPINSNAVYLVEGGQKRHIPNLAVFNSHGFSYSDIIIATPSDTALPNGSKLQLREGDLIKASGDAVYVIDDNSGQIQKRHITSMGVFSGLGYKSSEIRHVADSILPDSDGTDISSADQHPDGTLVKPENGSAVYLIKDGEKQHVLSPTVFNSQGFAWSRIKTATQSDLNLTTGSDVSFREGTVVQGEGNAIYVINHDSGTVKKRHITSYFIYSLLDLNDIKLYQVSDSQLPAADGAAIN